MRFHQLRSDGVSWRQVGQEAVILDERSSAYLSLNEAGTLLWKRLQTGATSAELAQVLRDTYALDHAAADRDVEAFLGHLVDQDLLR